MSTFILIHGSWHGAWNWHKVVPLLEKAGHRAIALDMPGHGLDKTPLAEVTLQSCADSICKVLDTLSEPAQDRAVSPSLQKQMYTAVPCQKVISMNTSHSPFFSAPDELVAHLLEL